MAFILRTMMVQLVSSLATLASTRLSVVAGFGSKPVEGVFM